MSLKGALNVKKIADLRESTHIGRHLEGKKLVEI